jgi:L-amino acid N-acyltransferase YncA
MGNKICCRHFTARDERRQTGEQSYSDQDSTDQLDDAGEPGLRAHLRDAAAEHSEELLGPVEGKQRPDDDSKYGVDWLGQTREWSFQHVTTLRRSAQSTRADAPNDLRVRYPKHRDCRQSFAVPDMSIRIRMADQSDAAAIADIYNVGIAERAATFETQPRTMEQIAERLLSLDRFPLLVAIDASGAVIGWTGLSEYSPRACYSGIAEFSIYLRPEARGQGTGTLLLRSLIDLARAQGFWKLVSQVFPTNGASRGLCRSCGFREVGTYERHGQLEGRWLDTVIVEKLLHQPGDTNRVRHDSWNSGNGGSCGRNYC